MTDLLKILGSFATIWLGTWVVLFLVLAAAYPLLRKGLLRLHPATSSGLLLTLLALPFLTSLLSTTLLFSPFLENGLFHFHDHSHTADCLDHFPFLNSFWLIGSVLGLTGVSLITLFARFLRNLNLSRELMRQLESLGEAREHWHQLPHQDNLVFTLGWLKSRIFITEGLLRQCGKEEIAIILDHEREHVRRLDNLRLLLGRLLTLFVPRPIARLFLDDLHLFTESACDFRTAEKHGSVAVAETLLRVQRLVPARYSFGSRSLACAFTGSEVERRINNLLTLAPTPRALPGKALFYVGVLLLLSVLIVDPLHHGVEWLMGDS